MFRIFWLEQRPNILEKNVRRRGTVGYLMITPDYRGPHLPARRYLKLHSSGTSKDYPRPISTSSMLPMECPQFGVFLRNEHFFSYVYLR